MKFAIFEKFVQHVGETGYKCVSGDSRVYWTLHFKLGWSTTRTQGGVYVYLKLSLDVITSPLLA